MDSGIRRFQIMQTIYIPVLLGLWLVAMFFSVTLGGLIHLFPILAFVLLIRKFSREKTTRPGDTGPRFH
jgi:F0F1-type ATP synthase assembly protein I